MKIVGIQTFWRFGIINRLKKMRDQDVKTNLEKFVYFSIEMKLVLLKVLMGRI